MTGLNHWSGIRPGRQVRTRPGARAIGAALVASLATVALWSVMRDDTASAVSASRAQAGDTTKGVHDSLEARSAPHNDTETLEHSPEPGDGNVQDHRRRAAELAAMTHTEDLPPGDPINVYLRHATYPPHSRPLTERNVDLLEWNRRYEQVRAVSDGTGDDSDVTFLLTGDAYRVVGDQTLQATLQVWRGGEPIDVAITRAFLAPRTWTEEQALASPFPAPFQAIDSMHVATLQPGAIPGLEGATMVGVFVEFDHGNGQQRASFDIHVTPAATVPARFTGHFRDEIADGDLVIHAEIEVDEPGRYVIDGNLRGADHQPISWTRSKTALDAGVSEVRLVVAGKVLHDRAAVGPYELRDLRGFRLAPGSNPDTEAMAPLATGHRTAHHELAEFSDAPWDSAHKRATLEKLLEARDDPGAPQVFAADRP